MDYYDGRLKIVNQSDKVICFDHAVDTILDVPSINKKEYFIQERIEPGDTSEVVLKGSSTKWIMKVSSSKDSTLSIFIFNYDQVLINDWDSLRINKRYKRLDYKLNDLNKNNCIVIVE
ncbi:MAG: hypothetical protein QY309_09670 [Cyclobacteriaceae bacterium]|nr:MAG: hypothetical protein QY309_09670 [Cyclobacteriaceae bacterium]